MNVVIHWDTVGLIFDLEDGGNTFLRNIIKISLSFLFLFILNVGWLIPFSNWRIHRL
jgi:hypothetical protein